MAKTANALTRTLQVTLSIALVGAFALMVWRLRSTSFEQAAEVERARSAAAEAAGTSAVAAAQAAEPRTASATEDSVVSDSQRFTPEAGAALHGRCVTPSGAPVAGAEVTWTVLPDERELGAPTAWVALDRGVLDAATARATSDARGYFAFASAPPRADRRPSVVWATATNHLAARSVLAALGNEAAALALDALVLEPAAGARFRVVNDQNIALAGAMVELLATHPFEAPASDPLENLAARVFVRRLQCDERGEARGFAFPASIAVRATHAERWSGQTRAPRLRGDLYRLVIGHVASAEGVVAAPLESLGGDSLVIQCNALDANKSWRALAQAPVRADGAWGPVELALAADVTELHFSGVGTGLFVYPVQRPPPPPGESVFVELRGAKAEPLAVRVADEDGEAIPGARVTLQTVDSSTGRWAPTSAYSEWSGIALVPNCVAGTAALYVQARGFAPHDNTLLELGESWPSAPVEVVLQRAGSFRGRVVHGGKPVESFEIVYWQGPPSSFKKQSFRDRDDGVFEIDTAPLGEVWAFAASHPLGQTAPVALAISRNEQSHVELELDSPPRARGRVVDAATLAPIAGAEVRVWARARTQMTVQLGRTVTTGPDGKFELEGVVVGSSTLMVTADGYGMVNHVAAGPIESDVLELIDLPLTRKEPFTVELRSTTQEDFTKYRLEVQLQDWAPPPQDFDSAGRAHLAAITPGRVAIAVSSDAGVYLMTTAFERPGRSARRVVELDPGTTLAVKVRADQRQSVAQSQLVLSYPGVDGREVESYALEGESGQWRFSSVPTRRGTLTLSTPEGILLVQPVALNDGPNELELELPEAPLELRVVDTAGAPVPGAIVRLDSDANPGWSPYVTTNADGRAWIAVPQSADLRASIFSEVAGIAADSPLARPTNGSTAVELVLDASCALEIELRDGATPLSAVKFHLFNSNTTLDYGDWVSGRDGVVELTRVMRGSGYRAIFDQPGLWRTVANFTVEGRRTRSVVDVRRTGELELVVERVGAPAAGIEFALRSIEFDTEVEHWLESGRVECSARELRTDDQGRLIVRGLPHGEYELRCEQALQRVSVQPRARNAVEIALRPR